MQKNEITEYHIYTRLASRCTNPHNASILSQVGGDERRHYNILKAHTNVEVTPSRFRVFLFTLMARFFGLTFSLKLMENGEKDAEGIYDEMCGDFPEAAVISKEEEDHEHELLNMIDEEALKHMGSVVLGLNDALVELSGALAGFTFAIQNSRTIALMGLITGVAATFSMAASEFLSQRQDGEGADALKSSVYTGIAYIGTVVLLVLPFMLFTNPFVSLAIMMATALLIILVFNFYISVAKDLPFRRRFLEMASISVGVAALSFCIGWVVRTVWGLDI